ncbi:O-methyltransferase [Actinomycetaceae bacterium TAE3-ERU4]|nr:O-methyltransferase [Actinomycetaceae bacterium TAE3-ERU4]
MDIALSWDYAESFVPETETILATRLAAIEVGAGPVSAGIGSTLRVLARAINARSVFEVGTGCGVSGLYLLEGMNESGMLTSVEIEGEFQRLARSAFLGAGYSPSRMRLFGGRALDLMPRMNTGAYDMVVLDGDPEEMPYYALHAARMLRSGGVLACVHALWGGAVADPARRDMVTLGMRETGRELLGPLGFIPCLLPVGDGLLVAVKP